MKELIFLPDRDGRDEIGSALGFVRVGAEAAELHRLAARLAAPAPSADPAAEETLWRGVMALALLCDVWPGCGASLRVLTVDGASSAFASWALEARPGEAQAIRLAVLNIDGQQRLLGIVDAVCGLRLPAEPSDWKNVVPERAAWFNRVTGEVSDPVGVMAERERAILVERLSLLKLASPMAENFLRALREADEAEVAPIRRREDAALERLAIRAEAVCGMRDFSALSVRRDAYAAGGNALLRSLTGRDGASRAGRCATYLWQGVPFAVESPTLGLSGATHPEAEAVLHKIASELTLLSTGSVKWNARTGAALTRWLAERPATLLPEARERIAASCQLLRQNGAQSQASVALTWPWDAASDAVGLLLRDSLGEKWLRASAAPFSDRLTYLPGSLLGDAALNRACAHGDGVWVPPLSPTMAACAAEEGFAADALAFQPHEDGSVTATLTLQGEGAVQLSRTYGPEEICVLQGAEAPQVALWPSLPLAGWRAYHVFIRGGVALSAEEDERRAKFASPAFLEGDGADGLVTAVAEAAPLGDPSPATEFAAAINRSTGWARKPANPQKTLTGVVPGGAADGNGANGAGFAGYAPGMANAAPAGYAPAAFAPPPPQSSGYAPGMANAVPTGYAPAGYTPVPPQSSGYAPGMANAAPAGYAPAAFAPTPPQPSGMMPGDSFAAPTGYAPAGYTPTPPQPSGMMPGDSFAAPTGYAPAGYTPTPPQSSGMMPGDSFAVPTGYAPAGYTPVPPQPSGMMPGMANAAPTGYAPAAFAPDAGGVPSTIYAPSGGAREEAPAAPASLPAFSPEADAPSPASAGMPAENEAPVAFPPLPPVAEEGGSTESPVAIPFASAGAPNAPSETESAAPWRCLRLAEFPACLTLHRDGLCLGALPNFQPIHRPESLGDVCIGVDLGGSRTTVAFAVNGEIRPLEGRVPLRMLVQPAAVPLDAFLGGLMPANPTPTAALLTGPGDALFTDGCAFRPGSLAELAALDAQGLRARLKWRADGDSVRARGMLLHQVMLDAALTAAMAGAERISFRLGIPDEMGDEGREALLRAARESAEAVSRETGLPLGGENVAWAEESAALRACLKAEGPGRGSCIIVDLGSTSTKLHLWLQNQGKPLLGGVAFEGVQDALLRAFRRDPMGLLNDFADCGNEALLTDVLTLVERLNPDFASPRQQDRLALMLDSLTDTHRVALGQHMNARATAGQPTFTQSLLLETAAAALFTAGLMLAQAGENHLQSHLLPDDLTLCLTGRGAWLMETLPASARSALQRLAHAPMRLDHPVRFISIRTAARPGCVAEGLALMKETGRLNDPDFIRTRESFSALMLTLMQQLTAAFPLHMWKLHEGLFDWQSGALTPAGVDSIRRAAARCYDDDEGLAASVAAFVRTLREESIVADVPVDGM